VPAEAVDGAAAAAATAPMVDAARALVAALTLPRGFDLYTTPPANPRLQAFYAALEGIALNLKPDEVVVPRDGSLLDASLADPAQAAAVAAFDAFSRAALPPPKAAKRARKGE
jgi:hypothetical protein